LRGEIQQIFSADAELAPSIGCNAHNCIYNENLSCQAKHVNIVSEIADTAEQTECQTFYPR